MNEPRDPVDRLLKAELRAIGGDALTPATSDCVDAETFAAWADGTLPPQQTSAIEMHLADCARCQALMAAFAQTEPAVAAVAAPAQQPWFRRWAMPLAAAAAVTTIAVWLTRSTTPTTPVTPPASTLAEADTKKLEAPPPQPAQGQGQRGRLEDRSSKVSGDRAAMSQLAKNDKDQKSKEEFAKRTQANETKTRADVKPADPATLPVTGASSAPARQVPLAAPTPPPAAMQPPPPPPVGATVSGVAGGVAQPAAQPTFRAAVAQNELRDSTVILSEFSSNAFQEQQTAQGGAAAGAGGRGGGGGGRGGGRAGAAAGSASNNAVDLGAVVLPRKWRIHASGLVERSTDGTNWERVTLDAPAQITSGVAPSPLVCWLVGRNGAVFISLDASRFAKLVFPEAVDLASIRATNAREATVTTADGRTFVTADGGISWTVR